MIGPAVRQLAAARNTSWICAAFVEKIIQVWDLATRRQIGQFDSVFDFGAHNLALHPDGRWIVAGRSGRRSGVVVSYDGPGGAILWRRDRLAFPAGLQFSPSGSHVYYTSDNRSVHKVDAEAGQTSVIRGTCNYFEGPYGFDLIIPSSASAPYVVSTTDASEKFTVSRLSFAVLGTAFSPDCVFLTESGGSVRCVDCVQRNERWRFDPPDGSHVLSLHWSKLEQSAYGVLWHYERGLFRYLVRFDSNHGRVEKLCELHSWDEAFVDLRHELITSHGDIIDLSTGQAVDKVPFPQMEYPDKVVLDCGHMRAWQLACY